MTNIKRWRYMSPFKRRKMKQQRITQGFCDYDAWGMNEFLATIIPAMLNKLADDGQSYAGNSKEEWKSRLSAIAMEFEQLRELLICDNILPANRVARKAFGDLADIFNDLWD